MRSVERYAALELLRLGISADLRGYAYVIESVRQLCKMSKEKRYTDISQQELYRAIAAECGATAGSVESGIRHAVEVLFDRTNMADMYRVFGNTILESSGALTVKQFVYGFFAYCCIETGNMRLLIYRARKRQPGRAEADNRSGLAVVV